MLKSIQMYNPLLSFSDFPKYIPLQHITVEFHTNKMPPTAPLFPQSIFYEPLELCFRLADKKDSQERLITSGKNQGLYCKRRAIGYYRREYK